MPRKKREGESKQGRYQPKSADVVLQKPPESFTIPPARIKLTREAARSWTAFWTSPLAMAIDSPTGVDRAVVDRWIKLVDELERLDRKLDPLFLAPVRKGQEVGAQVAGMGVRVLERRRRDVVDEIQAVQKELGLTPLARMRLGLTRLEGELGAARLTQILQQNAGAES